MLLSVLAVPLFLGGPIDFEAPPVVPSDVYEAAKAGDVQGVAEAIRAGIEINEPRREVTILGKEIVETPLFLAAQEGHSAVVKLLLESGADPNARCTEGGTALTIAAARYGRDEIIHMLLESGADVLGPKPMNRTAFGWAAMNGDYASFLALLEASRTAGMNKEQEAAVLEKLKYRNDDLRHLFAKVLKIGEATDPLQWAARRGSVADLQEELERALDPAAAEGDGWTPLHWAAGLDGSFEKARLLIKAGVDVNARTSDGFTPLMAAAQAVSMDRIAALIEAGARPNDVDVDQRSVLHIAAWRCNEEIIQYLLDHGADVKLENLWTQTPLDLAGARKRNLGVDVTGVLRRAWEAAHWPNAPDEIELVPAGGKDSPGQAWTVETHFRPSGAGFEAYGGFWINNPTVEIAFDIIWSWEGTEVVVGSLAERNGIVRGFSYAGELPGPPPTRIDLVLRPNRRLAFEQLKTWRIWGEEVVISNVAVNEKP